MNYNINEEKMKILQRSLPSRIFLAVCSFIGTIICLGYGFFFIIEHIGFLPIVLFFSIGLGLVFLTSGINVLMARIEYDNEKLMTRSFKKTTIIYFKEIKFFGRKVGSSSTKSRVYYWIIKKIDGTTFQIDIPVNFQTQEFEDFVVTIQKANPNVFIKK